MTLLKILNSSKTNIQTVRNLQKEKGGIKNQKPEIKDDLKEEKDVFIKFYNHVYTLLNSEKDEIMFILVKIILM